MGFINLLSEGKWTKEKKQRLTPEQLAEIVRKKTGGVVNPHKDPPVKPVTPVKPANRGKTPPVGPVRPPVAPVRPLRPDPNQENANAIKGFGYFQQRINKLPEYLEFVSSIKSALTILQYFQDEGENHPILDNLGIRREQIVKILVLLFGKFNSEYDNTEEEPERGTENVSYIGDANNRGSVMHFLFQDVLGFGEETGSMAIDKKLGIFMGRCRQLNRSKNPFFDSKKLSRLADLAVSARTRVVQYDDPRPNLNIKKGDKIAESNELEWLLRAIARGGRPERPIDYLAGLDESSQATAQPIAPKPAPRRAPRPVVVPETEYDVVDAEFTHAEEAPTPQPEPVPVVPPTPVEEEPKVEPVHTPIKPEPVSAQKPVAPVAPVVPVAPAQPESARVAKPVTPIVQPAATAAAPAPVVQAPQPMAPVVPFRPATRPASAPVAPAAKPAEPAAPATKPVENAVLEKEVLDAALSAASTDKTWEIRKLRLLAEQLTQFDKNKATLSKIVSHRSNPFVSHFMDHQGISPDEIVAQILVLIQKQGKVLTPANVGAELKNFAREILPLQ